MAQSPQPPPSSTASSPQQQAMGYFAGYWKIAGTTRISPKSPPVDFTSTQSAGWVPGGYFLEVHAVSHGPLGDVHTVRMLEYNNSDKVYTYNEYNSLGEHVLGVGNIEGKKWVWNTTKKMNGVVTKGRYITMFVSEDSYSFQSQVGKPGGGWVTITEGTATRTPPPQP
jgi:hypothetical protein